MEDGLVPIDVTRFRLECVQLTSIPDPIQETALDHPLLPFVQLDDIQFQQARLEKFHWRGRSPERRNQSFRGEMIHEKL